MKKLNRLLLSAIIIFMLHPAINIFAFDDMLGGSIRPYSKNPWYWQYNGRPILLRGASDQDNLWQWTGKKLTDHLDLLVSVGGNYLRCTMSDRNEGNAYAFKEIRQGVYDLDQWNEDYWERIKFFLSETHKREIIIQMSIWDHIDLGGQRFENHPLNPANNINWEVGFISGANDFYGITIESGRKEVIDLQNRYVNKLLSITLNYNHVLYNIDNETTLSNEWQNYWATFLKNKAAESGKEIHVTTMNMVPSHSVRHVLTYRHLYSFAEVSQNNQDSKGGRGTLHYDNLIHWRRMIEADPQGPLPMNNEKIYGSGDGRNYSSGTGREAIDRFWKNIFAGCASVRFHRPEGFWGIGLSEQAQASVKSMTMFLEEFDIFNAVPYVGIKMYGPSEGYAMAIMGKQYAVYLPGGRYSIELDPWIYAKQLKIKFLDIDSSTWSDEKIITLEWEEELSGWYGFQRGINIMSPGNQPCVAVLEVIE